MDISTNPWSRCWSKRLTRRRVPVPDHISESTCAALSTPTSALWNSVFYHTVISEAQAGNSHGRRILRISVDGLDSVTFYELHDGSLLEQRSVAALAQALSARVVYIPGSAATSFVTGTVMHASLSSPEYLVWSGFSSGQNVQICDFDLDPSYEYFSVFRLGDIVCNLSPSPEELDHLPPTMVTSAALRRLRPSNENFNFQDTGTQNTLHHKRLTTSTMPLVPLNGTPVRSPALIFSMSSLYKAEHSSNADYHSFAASNEEQLSSILGDRSPLQPKLRVHDENIS